VNTGLLDMLANGVHNQVALGSNTVNINLLGALNELADDDRVVRRDAAGSLKLVLEILLAVDDGHGSARQDVTGTNQDRIADLLSELLSLLNGGKLLPGRLVNTDAVKDLRELLTILGLVDVLGVSAQNVGTASLLQTEGNVLRELTSDRNHDT
jgi:hypothetical protein